MIALLDEECAAELFFLVSGLSSHLRRFEMLQKNNYAKFVYIVGRTDKIHSVTCFSIVTNSHWSAIFISYLENRKVVIRHVVESSEVK